MSNEALWDFTGKKVLCTHQKYYSLVFYIFASVKPLFLQLLSFQISGEIGLNSLFKIPNGYDSTGGQVSQSVFRTIAAEQLYSCVTCSFLLSPVACRCVAVVG